jgi:hypothetical protein
MPIHTMEQQEISTMVKASKLAIAIAVVAPLSAAAVSEASAAPVSTNAIASGTAWGRGCNDY